MQIEDIRLSMKLALEVPKKVLRKVKIAMLEQSDNFFIQLKKENNAFIFKLAKLFRIKINKDFFKDDNQLPKIFINGYKKCSLLSIKFNFNFY